MALLDKAKAARRISAETTVFDDELQDCIAAAIADLRKVGIVVTETQEEGSTALDVDDPLIIRAVILYVKSEFGYSENSEKYRAAYDYLKCALALDDDYTTEPEG